MQIQPGLTYLTRTDWGANRTIPRLGVTVSRSERTEAIIHHTVIIDSDATKNLWTNLAEVKAKMRQLQTIRPDLGKDVPYNFVMFLMEDGTIIVCEGRGLDRRGAHTKYHNRTGMATALQGNFMLSTRGGLSSFIPAMSRWWGWLKYDMKLVNLGSKHPVGRIAFGHVDLSATACPGDNLYAVIPQLTFKEDDMALDKTADWAVFEDMFRRACAEVGVAANDRPGHATTGRRVPAVWFDILEKHRKDAAQHSAGEGHDHGIPAGRTEEA